MWDPLKATRRRTFFGRIDGENTVVGGSKEEQEEEEYEVWKAQTEDGERARKILL
jgi:hypothetical protein